MTKIAVFQKKRFCDVIAYYEMFDLVEALVTSLVPSCSLSPLQCLCLYCYIDNILQISGMEIFAQAIYRWQLIRDSSNGLTDHFKL